MFLSSPFLSQTYSSYDSLHAMRNVSHPEKVCQFLSLHLYPHSYAGSLTEKCIYEKKKKWFPKNLQKQIRSWEQWGHVIVGGTENKESFVSVSKYTDSQCTHLNPSLRQASLHSERDTAVPKYSVEI